MVTRQLRDAMVEAGCGFGDCVLADAGRLAIRAALRSMRMAISTGSGWCVEASGDNRMMLVSGDRYSDRMRQPDGRSRQVFRAETDDVRDGHAWRRDGGLGVMAKSRAHRV